MALFRKKPVVIEAMQFCNGDRRPILAWLRENKAQYDAGVDASGDFVKIRTLEGAMDARENDWIIKGVKGEFYPCKPDIFDATYEQVES